MIARTPAIPHVYWPVLELAFFLSAGASLQRQTEAQT